MNGGDSTAAALASAALLERREELALAVTDEIFRRHPDYDARFGETGRPKTLQDMRHTIEFLAPAVALEDASMFARYVTWLVDVLRPRGVPPLVVHESLDAFRDVIGRSLPLHYDAAIGPVIDAGLVVAAESAHG